MLIFVNLIDEYSKYEYNIVNIIWEIFLKHLTLRLEPTPVLRIKVLATKFVISNFDT